MTVRITLFSKTKVLKSVQFNCFHAATAVQKANQLISETKGAVDASLRIVSKHATI